MPKFKLPPKLPFNSLGLAGLGLIGGSLAKALIPFGGLEINIFDSDPETVRSARKIKRFARVTEDPEEFIGWPMDLAYLCLPVRKNIEMVKAMGQHKVSYAVTDSGSTKALVNEAALEAGLNFCGGHPIAGREVAGFANSSADLLRGCLYILTPDERFGRPQTDLLERLRSLHELLDCRIRLMSPAAHDRLYSLVSHLPYLTASALAETALLRGGPDVLPWIGTGFKDTTRVGASPPAKWVDVTIDNADNLVEDISQLIDVLDKIKNMLSNRNSDELRKLLNSSSEFRQKVNQG